MYLPFSVKFYLRDLRAVEGPGSKHKVYCRLILDRRKSEFATNIVLGPKHWDADRETTRFSYLNEEIADLRAKLFRIKRTLEENNKLTHPRDIIDVLKERNSEKHFINDFFDKHLQKIIDMGEHSASTIKHYKLALKYWKKFVSTKLQKDDLLLREINYEIIEDYDYFLKVTVKDKHDNNLGRNHINKQHSILRTVLKQCMKEGLLNGNPYHEFMLKDTRVVRHALTEEELKRIENDPLQGNMQLDLARDIFLFSVYTSLRYGDAMDLSMKNIEDANTDEPYLKVIMEKTEKDIFIPLIPKARALIKKYEKDGARLVKNYILPRMSNARVNIILKDIAMFTNINKNISHHIARHTFATHGLNLGIPKEVISEILGHTSLKTTDIYAKMSVARKKEEMKRFK
jgi:integrase/recombinase XerD